MTLERFIASIVEEFVYHLDMSNPNQTMFKAPKSDCNNDNIIKEIVDNYMAVTEYGFGGSANIKNRVKNGSNDLFPPTDNVINEPYMV
jgi:hypothetical protein